MSPLIWVVGVIVGIAALSKWLRRYDKSGYPSRTSEGEEHHPEPGVQYRPLEVPPKEPFD